MVSENSLPTTLGPLSKGLLEQHVDKKRLYTAPELLRLTGMTRKQVSYWAKIGLIAPIFRNTDANNGKPDALRNRHRLMVVHG